MTNFEGKVPLVIGVVNRQRQTDSQLEQPLHALKLFINELVQLAASSPIVLILEFPDVDETFSNFANSISTVSLFKNDLTSADLVHSGSSDNHLLNRTSIMNNVDVVFDLTAKVNGNNLSANETFKQKLPTVQWSNSASIQFSTLSSNVTPSSNHALVASILKEIGWCEVESFNSLAINLGESNPQQVSPLISDAPHQLAENAELNYLQQLYHKADSLANLLQQELARKTLIYYVFSGLALITLMSYFKIYQNVIMLAAYAGLVSLGLITSYLIQKNKLQRNYFIARTFAENARICYFSLIADGLSEHSVDIFDSFTITRYMQRKLGTETRWIFNSLAKYRLMSNRNEPKLELAQGNQLILTDWISNQRAYFEKALTRNLAAQHKLKRTQLYFFLTSILAATFLFSITLLKIKLVDFLPTYLGLSIAVSGGLGGILKAYDFTCGYSNNAQRFKVMYELFAQVESSMSDLQQDHSASYQHLCWDALMENVDWFSMKQSSKIKSIRPKKYAKNIPRNIDRFIR